MATSIENSTGRLAINFVDGGSDEDCTAISFEPTSTMHAVSSNVGNGDANTRSRRHEIELEPSSDEKLDEMNPATTFGSLEQVVEAEDQTTKSKSSLSEVPKSPSKRTLQSPRRTSNRQRSSRTLKSSGLSKLHPTESAERRNSCESICSAQTIQASNKSPIKSPRGPVQLPVVVPLNPNREIPNRTVSPQRITRRFKPNVTDNTLVKCDVPASPHFLLDEPISPMKQSISKRSIVENEEEPLPQSIPLSPTKTSQKRDTEKRKSSKKKESNHPSSPRKSKSSHSRKDKPDTTESKAPVDDALVARMARLSPTNKSLSEKSLEKLSSPSKSNRNLCTPGIPNRSIRPELQVFSPKTPTHRIKAPSTPAKKTTSSEEEAYNPETPTRKSRERMMAMYKAKLEVDTQAASPSKSYKSQKNKVPVSPSRSLRLIRLDDEDDDDDNEPSSRSAKKLPVVKAAGSNVTRPSVLSPRKQEAMGKAGSLRNMLQRIFSAPNLEGDEENVPGGTAGAAAKPGLTKSKSRLRLFGGNATGSLLDGAPSGTKGRDEAATVSSGTEYSSRASSDAEPEEKPSGRRGLFQKSISTRIGRWFKQQSDGGGSPTELLDSKTPKTDPQRERYNRSQSVKSLSLSGSNKETPGRGLTKHRNNKSTRDFRVKLGATQEE